MSQLLREHSAQNPNNACFFLLPQLYSLLQGLLPEIKGNLGIQLLRKLPVKGSLPTSLYSKLLNRFEVVERNEVKVFDAAEQCAGPNLAVWKPVIL